MAIITERLPRAVELGATRQEIEDLDIQKGDDGTEVRNAMYDQSLYEWTLAYPSKDQDDPNTQAVLDMYRVTRGGLHSFLWQDLQEQDYLQVGAPLGTGDGVTKTFQMYQTTTVGSITYQRRIRRPRNGTVKIYANGVLQGGVSTNYTNGLVTFGTAPAVGVILTFDCTYDYVVRFDDSITSQIITSWLRGLANIVLIETLDAA